MSTDPHIEAAAEAIADLWTDENEYGTHEDMARAALTAADKAATITEENPRDLIDALTDPDDCSFDHNNSCQAHGYYYLEIGEKCPNQRAKDWVANHDSRGTE